MGNNIIYFERYVRMEKDEPLHNSEITDCLITDNNIVDSIDKNDNSYCFSKSVTHHVIDINSDLHEKQMTEYFFEILNTELDFKR